MPRYGLAVKEFNGTAFFRSVLQEWGLQVMRYSEFHRDGDAGEAWDVCFSYKERPNVGILASAASRAGGISLVEYESSRRGRNWARGDLFFSDQKVGYEAEVKLARVNSNMQASRDALYDVVVPSLNEAVKAARNLNRNSDYRLGITFVVPRVVRDQNESLNSASDRAFGFYQSLLGEIRSELYERNRVHFMSWVAPECSRQFWLKEGDGKVHYPGIMLIGRFLRLPNRDD
ncbi:hypothetical protein [Ferrovibrio sp.]|uniref:hypothetical protein n=1 Tax=Ferrovibrio sp. TaxID=1917215 RepID=UPI0025C22611|nr:hypothetical protein [Ferrovibrio sp.]